MNKVDLLCDSINASRGLKSGEIGSLERHTDSSFNAVVEIGNNFGGYCVLATGDDKTLINFLLNLIK